MAAAAPSSDSSPASTPSGEEMPTTSPAPPFTHLKLPALDIQQLDEATIFEAYFDTLSNLMKEFLTQSASIDSDLMERYTAIDNHIAQRDLQIHQLQDGLRVSQQCVTDVLSSMSTAFAAQ